MKNLKNMQQRLIYEGGYSQQSRMIQDKKNTLDRAIKYSYQGTNIELLNSNKVLPALINPNKLVADYDEKILSVHFDPDISTGTIFKWIDTSNEANRSDSYWLIYLQDLTELAYFKGDIRRCTYQINWCDSHGIILSTYAAVRGPVEQKLHSINKGHVAIDTPNYTLHLLIPKNKDTLAYFQRYTKFYLQSNSNLDQPVCWEVQAIDNISLPNIIEVYANETYINNDQDDVVSGIVDGLIKTNETNNNIDSDNEGIVGDNFIKPGFIYKFTYIGIEQSEWIWDVSLPIEAQAEDNTITIKWKASYSGDFTLQYGNSIKIIKVKSLME